MISAGTKLGRYEIRSKIGEGGMGEVYLAQDTKLNRTVAIKVLPTELANDQSRMRRFAQEARTASSLSHPNVAHIYEIEEIDGVNFIAMEYIEGTPLDQQIGGRPIPIGESSDIAIQITDALDEAHKKGITHRDIKPSNIMITPRGRVKVLDFGLAKVTQATDPEQLSDSELATRVKTSPGVIMGTVHYMSPEQASGKEVDARTDIWSLGVVLFEMVTGRVPFEGATTSHVIVAVLEKDPPPLAAYSANVPEALEWIVTETLTKDREERIQTARELLKKLQRVKERVDANSKVMVSERLATNGEMSSAQVRTTAAERTTAPATESTSVGRVSSAEYVISQIKRHRWSFFIVLSLVVASLIGVGFGLYKFFTRNQSTRSGPALKVTPLTSSPGIERSAAFSRDGKQIAYVWTGESNDNFDIYVKLLGAGEPLRLTTNAAREMCPAWSPDGRYIAFLRGTGEGKGFYLIPALRGTERKLADAYGWTAPGTMPQALDYSPDGRTLAVVDKTSEDEPWSIFLISIETGERRRLTQPPPGYNGDMLITFSPDGSRLALARRQALNEGDIYIVPIAGGEPARITSDEAGIFGLAWASDGAEIIFSSDRGGGDPTLWRVSASGGSPVPVAGVGQNVHELSIARHGDRLAYAQMSVDFNIYRLDLTSDAGPLRAGATPVNLISSTRIEQGPQFSPDGRRVAFVSNRSGNDEIWVCDAEGKNAAQLTNFGGPHTDTPNWSPDGRLIAFTAVPGGNADIYVIAPDGGSPRRLTTDASAEGGARWSSDGRWIYFTSNRTGRNEVWKMPAGGGAVIQLTRGGGQRPSESPDGRTVYFLRGRGESGLWQVSAEGGEETQVFDGRIGPSNWTVVQRGIYFMTSQPGQTPYKLWFFDFATRQTIQVTTLEGPRAVFQVNGITVSPDEHSILYAQRDKLDFDLMLVENFH